jgi:Fe2+ transport system protein FeoA
MSETRRLSLDQVFPGARVVVRALEAERDVNGRMMQLGLVVGAEAEVLQSQAGGPMLIRARRTLLAVGREEAKKILVEMSR